VEAALGDTIFEQYTSNSEGNGRSGGGLGLAICRMIVEAHGGTIWMDSDRKGSLFAFVLPFEPRAMAELTHPGPKSEGIKIAPARVG
jgi:signal transduction histidine kinase